MASVQELLLAAQAKKSPFISMLEGVASGFGQAQNQALERAKVLIALEDKRQEMELRQREAEREAENHQAARHSPGKAHAVEVPPEEEAGDEKHDGGNDEGQHAGQFRWCTGSMPYTGVAIPSMRAFSCSAR